MTMTLLRGRANDTMADIDAALRDAATRLRETPDSRAAEREVLRRLIDDLLERRLQARDESVIRDYEHLITTR
jgi:hypothetical protein